MIPPRRGPAVCLGASRGRDAALTTYVALANWTDQGARAVADSPRRLDAARKALEGMGGRFVSFLMTMGEYDF
ncbi:MAG: GYD domain-containing protein, partial [Solirubrobacterales bacterium]|nr:GYD domain-containing protein [Solirubrobacterales bacterium]